MLVDIALDHPGIEFEEGDGTVSVPGIALRAMHRRVHVEVAPHEPTEGIENARQPLGMVGALDQRRRRNRPGIDHRVERPVVALVENDRVEGFA